VRDYAAQKGIEEAAALEAGMQEKSEQFKKSGAQIYVEPSAPEGVPVELKAAGKE
jgi:hypothetical protein